jgi:Fe-S cluster biogenesis protein NfuA
LIVDADAVAAAVDEVGSLLRADGGDLVLIEANPKTLRIRLELRFDDVSCADCILPPAELAQTINAAIGRRVPGEFELVLADPRT